MRYQFNENGSKKIIRGDRIMKENSRYTNNFINKVIQPNIEGRCYRYKKIDERSQYIMTYLIKTMNLVENISSNNGSVKFLMSKYICQEINSMHRIRSSSNKNYLDEAKLNKELRKYGEPTYDKKTGEIKENNLDFFRKVIYYRSTKSYGDCVTGIYLYNLVATPKFYDYLIESGLAKEFELNIPKDYKTKCIEIYNNLVANTKKDFEEVKKDLDILCKADKHVKYESKNNKITKSEKYVINNNSVKEVEKKNVDPRYIRKTGEEIKEEIEKEKLLDDEEDNDEEEIIEEKLLTINQLKANQMAKERNERDKTERETKRKNKSKKLNFYERSKYLKYNLPAEPC